MSRTLVIKQIQPLLLASTLASLVQAKDINIGWSGPGTWTTLPFVVAGERGFFQKENLAVRMITFRGINVLMAALISGELDYATILPNLAVSAARGIPVKILSSVTKGSSFAMVSRPDIDNLQGLKGKRIGINSFGSSLDYITFTALSRNGLDPHRDVAIVPIGGGTTERIAALISGSIDATMVTSPTEYTAEKQGLRTLATPRDLANFVRIQNTGIGATQKKIDKDGDEVVPLLRALRAASLFLQEQRGYAVGLFEKNLRFDRPSAEKFYSLLRDQYNPELTLPDGAIEDLLAVGTFRSKEKDKAAVNLQTVRDWSFAERARR